MSKNLAHFLDQPVRLLSKAIDKLESINNYPSEDARLLAENSQAVRSKIAGIGLDPDDTTGEELYQTLLVKFKKDSTLVDTALGLSTNSDLNLRIDKAIQLVGHIAKTSETWFLKHSVAKSLLRNQPPKKLMKQLNYRSIDSLLKRADINSVYLAMKGVESSSWQKDFAKRVARLTGSDYELRTPQFAKLSLEGDSANTLIVSDELIGAVGLSPTTEVQDAGVLELALLLADGLESLTHSEAIYSLGNLNPALLWWDQAKSLMAACGQDIVSLNLKDAAANRLDRASYDQRSLQHGQQSLWGELVSRYQNQVPETEEAISGFEANAAEEINKMKPRQLPKDLVVEYAEAIADEF